MEWKDRFNQALFKLKVTLWIPVMLLVIFFIWIQNKQWDANEKSA